MLRRYLIIEIRMPLISRETFEVYNLIPIPKKKGVDMVTLLPLAEIVAINIHKNSYFPMTVTDLHQCTYYDSTTMLCPIRTPEYHMKSDESLCRRNKGSANCKTNHEGCRNTWWELNKINSYLYFCCDACKIRVICGNQVTTETLINAGVMTLCIDCTINSETFTVHSQRLSTDTIHTQVEEVTLEIPPINQIIYLSVPELKQEPENEMKEQSTLLQDLCKQIEQLKTATSETNLSDRATYHDVHQYVVTYTLAAAAAIACAIYVYHRLYKHRNVQQKSETLNVRNPAPRLAVDLLPALWTTLHLKSQTTATRVKRTYRVHTH